ncbi:MAG TPA: cytochrome c [Gemmataceae bacterium]|jgi:mono/diheme cytochrome c family protein
MIPAVLSRFLAFLILILPLALVPLRLSAAETKTHVDGHPIVYGFERFYAVSGADAVKGGRLLLGELNCTSCHKSNADQTTALPSRQAPILDGIGSRVQRTYLRQFLRDPKAIKPGTTMPNLFATLSEEECGEKIGALVHFLASTGTLKQERPDRKAVPLGQQLYHQVGCVACHGSREAKGNAARLLPTSVPLGDLRSKYSIASLAAFLENPHAVRPSGRMPGILNKDESTQVANYLLQGQGSVQTEEFSIQPNRVEKGRELFTSIGCANCHQLSASGRRQPAVGSRQQPADAGRSPAPLDKLRPEGGCLSAEPKKGLPWYSLNTAQRGALAAILKSPKTARPSTEEIIGQTMTALNCYACHQRGNLGGIEDGINAFFATTQPEMGEEGRLPPPLHDAGAKLKPDYLQHIFNQGAHDRPYMMTRMPRFGANNVPGLIEAFSTADKGKIAPVGAVTFSEPANRIRSEARKMCGGNSLGCVKCHTFAGHRAEGVQGIDMLLMPRRLQHDWFYRYLLDPQKLRPGTRMPTAWTGGMTVLPDVLGGSTAKQIESIWVYLQDGGRAGLPTGLRKHSIPLIPGKEAIVYRNFIEGSGTRAIAVGYPEKGNLSFDANDLRLALIWQGDFLDVARHWNDRGAGFEPPLGDNVVHLPPGVAFAVLTKDDDPWPDRSAKELGYQFRGYRTSADGRPTFLYTCCGARIEDFPNAVAGKPSPSIRRVLTLMANKPLANLWFRAAVADKIEIVTKGTYRINGEWLLKLDTGTEAKIRKSGGKTELLVPVRFHDGKARIEQEFVW